MLIVKKYDFPLIFVNVKSKLDQLDLFLITSKASNLNTLYKRIKKIIRAI